MSVFDNMHGETATGASRWFQEGDYVARVRRCQHFMSRQGKGNGVAIEVTILAATLSYEAGRVSWIDQSILPASNEPGEVCSTVLWLDRQQPAMGNLKGFLLAASGLSEDQVIRSHADANDLPLGDPETAKAAWIAFAERATSGNGDTMAGAVVCARATLIKTKAGTPFTRVVWETPKAEVLEQYAA